MVALVSSMFERFTERARQVVCYAAEEAVRYGHDHVGSEHILLGLLREEQGLASQVLQSMQITDERVGTRLGEPPWLGHRVHRGSIPCTARGRAVVELAVAEAEALGSEMVASHHLLLALLLISDGGAVRLLAELGAQPEQLRELLLAELPKAPEEWPTSMQQRDDFFRELRMKKTNTSADTPASPELERRRREDELSSAQEAYAQASTDRQRILARDRLRIAEAMARRP